MAGKMMVLTDASCLRGKYVGFDGRELSWREK